MLDADLFPLNASAAEQGEIKDFVQGTIHSLFMEAKPPCFFLRQLFTGNLIKCCFDSIVYPQLAKVLRRELAAIQVCGALTINSDDGKVELRVGKIDFKDKMPELELDERGLPKLTAEISNYFRLLSRSTASNAGKIGGRSRSPAKRKAVLENIKKARMMRWKKRG